MIKIYKDSKFASIVFSFLLKTYYKKTQSVILKYDFMSLIATSIKVSSGNSVMSGESKK